MSDLSKMTDWEGYEKGSGVEKDPAQGAQCYLKVAPQNNLDAQNKLGLMYGTGSGVERDYDKAVLWYRKAAEQGSAGAQNDMGFMYGTGLGVAQDRAAARQWYRKATEKGDPTGQFNLGVVYENGLGVERNPAKASRMVRQSSQAGEQECSGRAEADWRRPEDGLGEEALSPPGAGHPCLFSLAAPGHSAENHARDSKCPTVSRPKRLA